MAQMVPLWSLGVDMAQLTYGHWIKCRKSEQTDSQLQSE